MSSQFIEHPPEAEGDPSLILIMDQDGNVTTDSNDFERLMSTRQLPEMGIKIVHFDNNQDANDTEGGNDDPSQLKLTVEELYPDTLPLVETDPSSSFLSSSLDILPSTSAETNNHEIVDPFSEMNPEQLQRLEHALASEQAKQILGENAAAMLDILSTDEGSAAFLQHSIKNDHCYTNLLPSSDPNGPSFFVGGARSKSGQNSKAKGKRRVGNTAKGRKVRQTMGGNGGSPPKRQLITEAPQHSKVEVKQNYVEYEQPKVIPLPEDNVPTFEDVLDIEDFNSETSDDVEDDNPSDEDYTDRAGRRKKKKPKRRKRMMSKKQPWNRQRSKSCGKQSTKAIPKAQSCQETQNTEKSNDDFGKMLLGYGPKPISPTANATDDQNTGKGKGKDIKNVPKKKRSKDENLAEGPRVVVETQVLPGETASATKSQPVKNPKRENRKGNAHFAEALGPALFSAPDIIRRVSTGEELPQIPPEKKNFTVGLQKCTAAAEVKATSKSAEVKKSHTVTIRKGESILKESVKAAKPASGECSKQESLLKQIKVESAPQPKVESAPEPKVESAPEPKVDSIPQPKVESTPQPKVTVESVEDKSIVQPSVSTEEAALLNQNNPEIQKLLEKHQSIPIISYGYGDDSSDDDDNENYCLDPSQMDHGLLENFTQTYKSEDQVLQEALLLQEQLIGQNKSLEFDNKPKSEINFDDTLKDVVKGIPGEFVSENFEKSQSELISSTLLESQINMKAFGKTAKKLEDDDSQKAREGKMSKSDQIPMDIDDLVRPSTSAEGCLEASDEKSEDRKRGSGKRRRPDEVSDLDSDLDDALSEASWNSEDDPDRLWCICRKPHNNRFMICCDVCEEWFHGKCVGITKTIGKQMEQDGLEWSCPNCAKKKKVDENVKETDKVKLLKEKMAHSIKEQQQKIRESQKMKTQAFLEKEMAIKFEEEQSEMAEAKIPDSSETQSNEDEGYVRQCIMCKKWIRENSIYCGDACIRKHSQHAISQLVTESSRKPNPDSPGPSSQSDDPKSSQDFEEESSRIIVMDANTKKVLVGQQAPTAANLTNWLLENPSYQVVYKKSEKTGKFIVATPKIVKIQTKTPATETPQQIIQLPSCQKVSVQQPEMMKSTQLQLAVSPTSKQVKLLPPSVNPGKKQLYQIISSTSGGSSLKPAAIIVRQKQSEGTDPLPVVVKSPVPKSSTKVTSLKTPVAPKETGTQKGDKMSRKKRDKGKGPTATITTKDLRQSLQKLEEGKEKEKRDSDQQIRDSVKKTLADTLKARVQDCEDLEFTDEYVDGLALEIEENLFRHFENKTDTKYKSKYRSLVFNIRDPKNETLFRKILDNSITPKDLVKLSPEELANQELARWREKENQHQLEMIKKTELELMTIGNTYIMKSHKGEQVIESGQSERVAAVAAEIDPNTPPQDLISALNSVSSIGAGAQEQEEDEAEEQEDEKEKEDKEFEEDQDEEHEELDEEEVEEEEEEEEDEDLDDEGEDEDDDSDEDEDDSEPAFMRINKKDKRRPGSKDKERKYSKKEKDRRRDRSRSRSRSRRHRSKDRKRSNRGKDKSRRRQRDKKSSRREKRDSSDSRDSRDYRDSSDSRDSGDSSDSRHSGDSGDSRGGPRTGSPGGRNEPRNERNDTGTLRDAGEKIDKKPPDEDADHEPSSTVTIKTPDINIEEPEPSYLWKGVIAMAEVSKFWGIAREISGNCSKLSADIGDKVDIVGRIPYDTVWDYIARMKRMATKDIILIKILPSNENEKSSYSTLYSYLFKRSRIGVIGRTSDAVKDFYLYPLASHASVPQVLLPLNGCGLEDERENLLLGIIVRTRRKSVHQRSLPIEVPTHSAKPASKSFLFTQGEPEKAPERSYTPPLPDEDKVIKKDPRLKRKIRVQVDFNRTPAHHDDGDSPYSPGDSDEDLPPLPKISKHSTPGISAHVKKFLSPAGSTQENFQDPVEIQKKIEEMNRAIEEQTQQIQSLTSTVPKLKTSVPLPNISLLSASLLSNTSAGVSTIPHSKPSTSASISAIKPTPEIVELPLISAELEDKARSPPRSYTPPIKIEENIPFLPEVKSKISLPSNLQEMLNSINKKSAIESNEAKIMPNPAKAVEDIVKSNTPDINMALNVLTQTKSLLNSLSSMTSGKEGAEKSDESTAILSRLSDEDIIRKAKEMEDLAHGEKDVFLPSNVTCPPRPLAPAVPNIPMITSSDNYGFNLPPSMFPHEMEEKSAMDMDERKQKKFRLDPKSVFEKEGVPDFMAPSTSTWDDKKQKQSRYKIDIKLSMASPEGQNADDERFDADGVSTSNIDEERKFPAPDSSRNIAEDFKYDVDERVMRPKAEERHRGAQDDRRRRNEEWESKRDWKYDRRHWEDARRFNKGDYNRRHGGRHYGGPKFRKDRFEDTRDRYLEKEWEGSIKDFEERQRRRNQEIRREELRRLRKRSDSSSN